MDEILGTKPATQPDVMIDTLADDRPHHDPEVMESIDEDVLEVGDDETSDVDKVNENEETKEESEEKKAVENTKEVEKPEIKAKTTAAMKRKANHESRIDKSLATLVNAVTKAQKESDQMFIAFEEKRMKLDEKLLMMEDRRLRDEKEREERQRKEEREFQLRMMMMLQRPVPPPSIQCGSSLSPYPLPYPTSSPYSPSSPYPQSWPVYSEFR